MCLLCIPMYVYYLQYLYTVNAFLSWLQAKKEVEAAACGSLGPAPFSQEFMLAIYISLQTLDMLKCKTSWHF